MIEELDYVSVPVENLSEAVRFYRDVLGLPLDYEIPRRWAEFSVGQTRLAIYPKEPDERRGGDIAFQVEDLYREVSRLKAHGVAFPHGIEAFEVPDRRGGLRVSLTRAGTDSNSLNMHEANTPIRMQSASGR